jgi:hypothetical protein
MTHRDYLWLAPNSGRAMPVSQARAATPSGLSRFASSCQHRIAIAATVLFWAMLFGLAVVA